MLRNGVITLDLDGTVIDCYPRQMAVIGSILRRLKLQDVVNLDTLWEHKRQGFSTAEALTFQRVDKELVDIFRLEWLSVIEQDEWLALDQPFPWSRDALQQLSGMYFSMVLLTARQNQDGVYRILNKYHLESFFTEVYVVSPQNAEFHKSNVLSRIQPIIHCGDSEIDAIASQNSGISFVGVSCGQRSQDMLRCYPSRAIIEDISRLPKFMLAYI